MSKGIKTNVELEFYSWKRLEERRPLELASTDGEQFTGKKISGVITLDKDELYHLLRSSMEDGEEGLFIMRIVD